MKKIITASLVFFLLSIVFAEEKNPINGYDGLEFAMSFEQVKKKIKKDGISIFEKVPRKPYYRYYKNSSEISVWFTEQRLVQIRDVFGGENLEKMESAIKVFEEKKKEFISKWGKPTEYKKI